MKCSTCYADNPVWAARCSTCGGEVLPLELCASGHLLPPGVRECPICPNEWPETPAFSGPPVLRGILWVERGTMNAGGSSGPEGVGGTTDVGSGATDAGARATGDAGFLEIRDQEAPVTLAANARGQARLCDPGDPAAVARLLMRPAGLMVCRKGQLRAQSGPLAYELLAQDQSLDIGSTRLRFLSWPVPQWVEAT